jgi:hypothetical protein
VVGHNQRAGQAFENVQQRNAAGARGSCWHRGRQSKAAKNGGWANQKWEGAERGLCD